MLQLNLTKARAGPLQEADLPAGVLLSTVVDSPVARYGSSESTCSGMHKHAAMPTCHILSRSRMLPLLSCFSYSLYHSLSNVFCPMLKLEQPGGGGSSSVAAAQQQQQAMDPQLGELLLDVQAGLGKAVRRAAGTGGSLQVCCCAYTQRLAQPSNSLGLLCAKHCTTWDDVLQPSTTRADACRNNFSSSTLCCCACAWAGWTTNCSNYRQPAWHPQPS